MDVLWCGTTKHIAGAGLETGRVVESEWTSMKKLLDGLTICYFGRYNPRYSRNRILIKALARAGARVVQVQSADLGAGHYLSLLREALKLTFDVLIVGFPAHADVPLGRLVCALRRRPLIFDPLVSLYDSAVWDRQLVGHNSLRAGELFLADALGCWLSDLVLLDTQANIGYFSKTFKVSAGKFRRVWVGADDEVMRPRCGARLFERFTVFFYGSFIPLHGVEYIVEAADVLERRGETIDVLVVGSGQTYSTVLQIARERGVRSVRFAGRVGYEALGELMCASDICLGIFGRTPKAFRVIPNKVFDAIAVARPVITADTPAVREAFRHGENIFLVRPGDGEALAEAILALKRDDRLRTLLGRVAYEHFRANFSIDAISRQIGPFVQEVVESRSRR